MTVESKSSLVKSLATAASQAGLVLASATQGSDFHGEPTAVFELSPNGSGGWNASVLHTFTGGVKDGMYAPGNLVLDQAGNLYGTTGSDGFYRFGTVFQVRPSVSGIWTESTIYSFKGGSDGGDPEADLTHGRTSHGDVIAGEGDPCRVRVGNEDRDQVRRLGCGGQRVAARQDSRRGLRGRCR